MARTDQGAFPIFIRREAIGDYGDGVALVDNVSIRTYAELAALGDFGLDDFLKR